jgi:peptide/nickel transport system permease protein
LGPASPDGASPVVGAVKPGVTKPASDSSASEEAIAAVAPPKVQAWQRFCRVFFGRKVVLMGITVLVLLVLIAIFADLIAPYPPDAVYAGPTLAQPSGEHWLGTDTLGRDVLSRIIHGSRVSLLIGFAVVIVASTVLGLLAGYYKWLNAPVMRVMDAFMAFPMVLLMMTIAAALGGGTRNVIIALSVAMLPMYVRVMCGMVLQARENDYVMALRAIGASHLKVLFQHILPNCLPPFIVIMTMQLGAVVLAEAGLSFLGIGITPPTAAWGSMINDGRQYLLQNPLLSVGPGVVLMALVYCCNIVGDGLRDALDPRLRGMI